VIRFNGVNHLAMATGDMDQTIRYWRDLLGMRLVAGLGHPGYRHYFFELSATDLIAFFEWPEVEPIQEKDHGRPVKGPYVFDHVSLGVETEEMLWELKDKLEMAGFWVSEIIDHGFIHSIYTFDPNHIPIEFSVAVADVDLRKHPKMMDKYPCKAAREGVQPQPGHWPEPATSTPESEKFIFPGEGVLLLNLLDDDLK